MYSDEEEQGIEIPKKYLAAFDRYKVLVIIAIFALATIAFIVSNLIPAVYRSQSVVLVETQQIPDDLVRSTVTSIAAERIQIIKQRVMTRAKLLEVVNKYPSLTESREGKTVSGFLTEIRNDITVELINSDNRRRNATVIAFRVGFDAKDPTVAQNVANDLVTLFLNENVTARTERASETTSFLESQATKMEHRLSEIEQAIAEFKAKNKDALPEHLDLYVSMLDRAKTTAAELQREIQSTKNQIDLLEIQLAEQPVNRSLTDPVLAKLRADYQALRTKYTDTHPDVVSMKTQLESYRPVTTSLENHSNNLIEERVEEGKLRIVSLENEISEKKIEIEDLETKIIKIPQVERGLVSLNRDYNVIKAQYDKVVANTMQAQMAESLEQGSKAERFSILEPAQLPDRPFSPDRKKLLVAGVGGSLAIPLGLVLLIGFMDRSIRDEKELEKLIGAPPIAVVGYIETKAEVLAKKKKLSRTLLVIFVLSIGGALAVHLLYMPLDVIYLKIIFKLSNLTGA
ncbi:hypothetical protein [Marinobacterium mangrovicola]|uniref:Polysaccharide chain length determinant protein (PEP-CTERM system associated) n=1 Tax=Marinobacterium mangrovicola TaxID=1476959 RepID=A0A4R1GSF5_9GAMM|nr:hypothetical protein [Marinobacterium mangrovicola]TCK07532.1 polysaccharide chain length determinant protein (PEP-CTERM system associated) [Marinobacterium mangrovicola]